MKVIQVVPVLAFGDAVGNDTIAIKNVLCEAGYETAIYAGVIDYRIQKDTAFTIEEMPTLSAEDIIIYHMSTGNEINNLLSTWNCKKIIMYHNITPPEFFEGYNYEAVQRSLAGIESVKYYADKVDYVIADSEFNKTDLLKWGYKCKIDVLPILVPFSDYDKKPNKSILKKYSDDGYVNLLFTGRIVPNKKQEDIIDAFYYYKKFVNDKARLFLVGSYTGMERYYNRLVKYVEDLGIEDVIFTGHVSFDEILAYYHLADVFVCMSEHEGFCVPIIEAMYFDIPIIARATSAVSETVGTGGLLLKNNDAIITAEVINEVVENQSLRERLLKQQKERLKDFSTNRTKELFLKIIEKTIHENKK